jgi:hypothetical protein
LATLFIRQSCCGAGSGRASLLKSGKRRSLSMLQARRGNWHARSLKNRQ